MTEQQCQLFPTPEPPDDNSWCSGFGVVYDLLPCGHYINRAHKERHPEGFCYQCNVVIEREVE